tara:strand:- start:95 stop:409 length:315 start_codon:yes stop_codon:yes gene_type:complete
MQAVPGQPVQYQQPVQYNQQQAMQQQGVVMASNAGAGPDTLVAYLLWFFLGIFGAHHLYIGRGIGIWLVSLFTMQGLGFWWLIDLFLIPGSCASRRNGGMVIIR